MLRKFEQMIEKLIMGSRIVIVVAVLFGILAAFAMVILGTCNVVLGLEKLIQIFILHSQFEELEKEVVTKIISAVDNYLIATVLLIFSIGLYELFISKIAYDEKHSPKILVIHDLDQLKENLAKVIIIVLIVTYFKYALEMDYQRILDLFFLSAGVFLIALSVYFMRHRNRDH